MVGLCGVHVHKKETIFPLAYSLFYEVFIKEDPFKFHKSGIKGDRKMRKSCYQCDVYHFIFNNKLPWLRLQFANNFCCCRC